MTYNSAKKRLLDLFIGIRGTKAVGKIVTSDSFYGLLKSSVFPAENISSTFLWIFKGLHSQLCWASKLRKRFIWNLVKLVKPVKMSIYEDILRLIFQDGNLVYRPNISNTRIRIVSSYI